MKKLRIALVISTLISGCIYTPQEVKVTPDIKLSDSMKVSGKAVKVSVVDERSSKSLGQRGAGNVGADLTVKGDISNIVYSAIKTGLEKQGSSPSINEGTKSAKLKAEIRNLDYKVITGWSTVTIRSECGIKAFCKSRLGSEYEKLYNGLFEIDTAIVPKEQENNEYVSAAVSNAINKLLNDKDLNHCLAE